MNHFKAYQYKHLLNRNIIFFITPILYYHMMVEDLVKNVFDLWVAFAVHVHKSVDFPRLVYP